MSVWSSLEGIIDLRRGCKCSVSKLIEEVFDDYRAPVLFQTEHHSSTRNHLTLEFCDDGQSAMNLSNKFIDKLLEYDSDAYVDLTFTTRLMRN